MQNNTVVIGEKLETFFFSTEKEWIDTQGYRIEYKGLTFFATPIKHKSECWWRISEARTGSKLFDTNPMPEHLLDFYLETQVVFSLCYAVKKLTVKKILERISETEEANLKRIGEKPEFEDMPIK